MVLPQSSASNNQCSQIKSVQKYLADVELRQVGYIPRCLEPERYDVNVTFLSKSPSCCGIVCVKIVGTTFG
jgi:hypothetical protein